jgi:hypothetical protein
MPEPIRWKTKVLLAKPEATYGTDPTLTGAANAILATDIVVNPMEGEDVSRGLERPYLGAEATIPAGLRTQITFSTELAGSGVVGTVPKWGVLMRGAGFAEVISAGVSVAYAPITSAMESLYFKFWIGATLHAIKGARGTGQLALNAQGIPVIRWTFTGLWVSPSEVAAAAPTLTGFQKPLVATKVNTPTFTLNAVPMVLRSYTLNFGCDVQPRLLIGKEEILIVDRAESLAVNVEAVPLTTFDPFALAQAQTLIGATIVHGTAAGNIATIAAPTSQVLRPAGYENQQNILEWPLRLTPLPNAGNDQISITLT